MKKDLTLLWDAIQETVDAWTDAGSHPEFHAQWQNKIRAEWPTLAAAVEKLVKEWRGPE